MSKVHDVDSKVIQRTQEWLASQQQADGSWQPDAAFINEGAGRINSGICCVPPDLVVLFGSRLQQQAHHLSSEGAVLGIFNREIGQHRQCVDIGLCLGAAGEMCFNELLCLFDGVPLVTRVPKRPGDVRGDAQNICVVAIGGASAVVETTALATQALLKWGGDSAVAAKAINYIVAKKDAAGTWGTTQATVMALRALLLSTEKGGATAKGVVEILLNGKPAGKLALTSENNDLLHQFVFKGADAQSANLVEVRFSGEGSVAYQVVGRYFLPWDERPEREALSIDVKYDRTLLAQDDIATATATVRNHLGKTANMVMVDLGIPPGFELLSEDLQSYQEKRTGLKSGRLEKFSLTATQAILYFDAIAPGDTFAVSFRLRAKYPIRARSFASRVYEYYDPEVSSLARPAQLEVRKR